MTFTGLMRATVRKSLTIKTVCEQLLFLLICLNTNYTTLIGSKAVHNSFIWKIEKTTLQILFSESNCFDIHNIQPDIPIHIMKIFKSSHSQKYKGIVKKKKKSFCMYFKFFYFILIISCDSSSIPDNVGLSVRLSVVTKK